MNEYEIKYEAPPISEVIKIKVIEAETVEVALALFRTVHKIKGVIIAITLRW